MEVFNMSRKFKRFLSVVSALAVVMCIFSGFATAKPVNAAALSKPGPVGPTVPFNPSFITFSNVAITPSSFPQGTDAKVTGQIAMARSSVHITVTLKKYYNSYSAYTVATFTDTMYPSFLSINLADSAIFKSQLNLKSRSTGHYLLEIQAQEYGRTINTTLSFYIT